MSTGRPRSQLLVSMASVILSFSAIACGHDAFAPGPSALLSPPTQIALALASGTKTQITTDASNQVGPVISGDRIGWLDYRSGTQAIYTYDLTTGVERRIADSESLVALSGDRIAWYDQGQILVFDLTTGVTQTLTNTADGYPEISGDYVVWSDRRAACCSNRDIYLYDLSTRIERRISGIGTDDMSPHVSGDRIVWRAAGTIYLFDISTGIQTRITPEGTIGDRPRISGDRIVWHGFGDANWDIYTHEISTGEQRRLTSSARMNLNPEISGERIVWIRYAETGQHIFMYDLTTNTESLVSEGLNGGSPHISGDRIVWHDSPVHNNYDVFMFELSRDAVPAIREIITKVNALVIDGSISNKGLAESLRSLLAQAEAAASRGNIVSAENTIRAFIRHVEAQSEKHMTSTTARNLIDMANRVIESLQAT